MEKPGFVIGNIAKGKDLWDRGKLISDIWKALKKTSVLLKAPRRFGKTTIMNNLYEYPKEDFKVFFIDTEGMSSPEDLISKLLSETLSELRLLKTYKTAAESVKRFLKVFEGIGITAPGMGDAEIRIKIRESVEKDWQTKGSELITALRWLEDEIIFILDELPVLVQYIEKKHGSSTAAQFLHWFRGIRQMPELSNIRWVVGGSIGIEHVLEKIGAGTQTINDFQILNVGPFSEEDGKAYVKALLQNEGGIKRIANSTLEAILELIGAPVPYFLQILTYESLNEMGRARKKTLNNVLIDKAYQEGVLGPASRTYFEHYYSRLKDYYDKNTEQIAKHLLLEVARQREAPRAELFRLFKQISNGEMTDEAFSYLMTDLENDFYIAFDTSNASYRFTTNILRDWWLRHHDLMEALN